MVSHLSKGQRDGTDSLVKAEIHHRQTGQECCERLPHLQEYGPLLMVMRVNELTHEKNDHNHFTVCLVK